VPLRVEESSTSADAGMSASTSVPGSRVGSAPGTEAGMLEIESDGVRVRFSGPVDAGALRLVLTHLGRRTLSLVFRLGLDCGSWWRPIRSIFARGWTRWQHW
jgi:hypothetical protein